MNIKKDLVYIFLAYLFVIILITLYSDYGFTILLILLLLIYHIYSFLDVKNKVSKDKKYSELSLMSKLRKTKKESEEIYRRFISLSTTLGSGIIAINEDGIISFANKDAKDTFNIDFNQKDYNSLVEIRQLYSFVNQAYLLEKSSREQIEYNNHYYDLVSTPIFEKGLFKGNIIVIHDVSSLKTAENFQKRFTADVSHELKTPLSAIKGISEILERDKDISVKNRDEFISLINKESSRMETILNDLLIISKMDRLDYELNIRRINIIEVLEEATAALKIQFKKKGLLLTSEIEECILELDTDKFRQVVLNILKNALNYTDKGSIDLKGYVNENFYIIEVKDTGIGIKENDLDKIFKRFYRVDKTRSRETGGSGLGLSISKNVIKKHGGNISVISELNKGTTFKISLPIKE